MHALAFRRRLKGEVAAVARRLETIANGLDARVAAVDVPIVNRQMFGRRIGLADIMTNRAKRTGRGLLRRAASFSARKFAIHRETVRTCSRQS
ncbi:protein of unknown function [Methylocella tundrae]|uniref:Uncharacterized protein n=1 Tax=Methylocella tundrae TaxID=227605 RepID=A0A4U8Z196_METTU|nr:protein of unknown function [Methylocella tundrae]